MNRKIIIGVTGLAGSGKDVFADIGVNEYNAIKIPFAKAVKEEVTEFLIDNKIPFANNNLYGTQEDKEQLFLYNSIKNNDIKQLLKGVVISINGNLCCSFRSLLQIWGTEYRRTQDPNYWIKKAFEQCNENNLYIISDCRFHNELDSIRMYNGYIVKIIKPDVMSISNMNHSSESELRDSTNWDYKIDNNSTLEDYQNKCRLVLEDIICLEN